MKGKYCLNFNCDTNCLDICINPYFVPIKVTIEYNVVSLMMGPGWLNELGSCIWITKQLVQVYHQYGVSSRQALKITKKGALDSQVIKFTSCLPMVGGSLWVLQLLPPLKLVAMILLKVALNTKN